MSGNIHILKPECECLRDTYLTYIIITNYMMSEYVKIFMLRSTYGAAISVCNKSEGTGSAVFSELVFVI